MKSLWSENIKLPEFKKAKGDLKTDVLIVGGGICGLLCAYFLKNAGVDYMLAEASCIASGTTKNTTAKITSQHGLIYSKLCASLGENLAQMYYFANEDALNEYRILCKSFDCDFETKDAYTYSLSDRAKIEKEVEKVNFLGGKAEFLQDTELPFSVKGAICFKNQAQFNPLKFIKEISKELNIYENTFIKEIKPGCAEFDGGRIFAEKIIVAAHFPFINKHGSYFMKLYQHRSYVAAFSKCQKLLGMYVDEDKKGLSFRNYNDLLLVGGGGHRTGKKSCAWQEIEKTVEKFYPQSEIVYRWAAQDTMSLDGSAYIGQYSENTPGVYVAAGFNKWGMTLSMVAAKLLCSLVQGKRSDFEEVFSPSRSILKPQLFVNGFETISNLLMFWHKRCPHMGCALKWNKNEHSWDCPCHGSRFDAGGKLIDNPSIKDLKLD